MWCIAEFSAAVTTVIILTFIIIINVKNSSAAKFYVLYMINSSINRKFKRT